jgi:diacylglycerol kinase family enzyme
MDPVTPWLLLNPRAHQHRGERRYAKVASRLPPDTHVQRLDDHGAWQVALTEAISNGQRFFVAAGGDGTVGSLIDGIERFRGAIPLIEFTLGAVGLGSSNDFHRPHKRGVAGVPLRLDSAGAKPCDVGRLRFVGPDGHEAQRCFAVSASVGVIARANHVFNVGGGLLGWLKPRAPDLAALVAALSALSSWKNQRAHITLPNEPTQEIMLANLSVGKTRFAGGGFAYDIDIAPDDRLLAVNLGHGMSRGRLVRAFVGLLFGRFRGQAHTLSTCVPCVSLVCDTPMEVELDGEIAIATEMHFDLLPQSLRVCAP